MPQRVATRPPTATAAAADAATKAGLPAPLRHTAAADAGERPRRAAAAAAAASKQATQATAAAASKQRKQHRVTGGGRASAGAPAPTRSLPAASDTRRRSPPLTSRRQQREGRAAHAPTTSRRCDGLRQHDAAMARGADSVTAGSFAAGGGNYDCGATTPVPCERGAARVGRRAAHAVGPA
mmetsp:Transcript_12210/g.42866  ORF Transcript_12210/g.42866 Transcript_12210/m.42866 type:complete len:181 (-) Transcript_12210:106-648(-)